MEFHLPFFALRKAPSSGGPTRRFRGKRLQESEELILLTRENTESDGQENYYLYAMHMACVTSGFGEWQWTNWTFEDTVHGVEEDDEVDDGEVGAESGGAEAVADQVINEDPIVCGLDANNPIWRPRQYFLKAFEIRIKNVRREWDALVQRLEIDRKEYVCFPSYNIWIILSSNL
jgi:hypothetical protein